MLQWRFGRKWSQFLLIYGVLFVLGLILYVLAPEELRRIRTLALVVIVSTPAVVIGLILLIGIHEFGHFVAAKLAGMEVRGFCVGPLKWMERNKVWKFSWHDDTRLGGFVLALQKTAEFDRKQYLALYLGGPIGSVAAVLIAGAAYLSFPDYPIFTGVALAFSALFLINFIPMRTGGIGSDGYWIFKLLFDPKVAELGLSTARLQVLVQQDIPADEWPPEIVAALRKLQGATMEAIAARLFELSYALTIRNPELAIIATNELQQAYFSKEFADPAGNLRAIVVLDIALVRAEVERDAASARELMAKLDKVPEEVAFLHHEVMAFVLALEGDEQGSLEAVRRAVVQMKATLSDKPRWVASISSRLAELSGQAKQIVDEVLSGSKS